jgi:hypothetical protein
MQGRKLAPMHPIVWSSLSSEKKDDNENLKFVETDDERLLFTLGERHKAPAKTLLLAQWVAYAEVPVRIITHHIKEL